MTPVPLPPVALLPGVLLAPSLSLDPPRLDLVVEGPAGLRWSGSVEQDHAHLAWRPAPGAELDLDADFERGELRLTGLFSLPGLLHGHGKRFEHDCVLRWAPSVGRVGDDAAAFPPDPGDGAGPVRSLLPTITRFPIDDGPRLGTHAGSLVKQVFFPSSPAFDFNVCFAVGPGGGAYGDPLSRWFNVFLGYYQIDCPKPAWTRPFGYRIEDGVPRIDIDEIVRMGKADWNYLSNWMYGVPIDAIRPHDAPDDAAIRRCLGRAVVGDAEWDVIDVDGVSVVSTYAPGGAGLETNSPLTPLWRGAFGEPVGTREGFEQSFPPTSMHGRFYSAFTEDEQAYRTVMFGGTVNKAFDGPDNDAFLAAQLDACAAVVAARYPGLGFPRG